MPLLAYETEDVITNLHSKDCEEKRNPSRSRSTAVTIQKAWIQESEEKEKIFPTLCTEEYSQAMSRIFRTGAGTLRTTFTATKRLGVKS